MDIDGYDGSQLAPIHENEEPIDQYTFTKHIRTKNPLLTKISGQKNKGVIYKPVS